MAYTGLVFPIALGVDGFTGNKNQTSVPSTQLIEAHDVSYEYGTLSKEGGAIQYNSASLLSLINSGYDWWPTPDLQRMVVFCANGGVYKDSGTGTFPVTLVAGLNAPDKSPQFITAGSEVQANPRKLFLFTDSNPVQVLAGDGTTMAPLAQPPTDWGTTYPCSGCVHSDRLWGAAGHYVYFSNTQDHEDFLTATPAGTTGQISVYPGVGDEIVHIEDFKGMLLVFKRPFGIYFIDDSSPDITTWTVNLVSDAIGAVGPGCVVSTDNDVLFMDRGGSINQLSAVTQELPTGTFVAASLTYAAIVDPYIRDNFNFAELDGTQSIYYAAKREVHFAVPYVGSSINNARMVVDFNRPDIVRFRDSLRDTCPALWLRKDQNLVPRPVYGDNQGTVWLMDQLAKSLGTAGYLSQWQTGYEDFSQMYFGFPAVQKLGSMNKNFHFMELVAEPKGNWNLMIDFFIDGEFAGTNAFNMGVTGAPLDVFTLDRDQLASGSISTKRQPLWGSGRRISFQGSTSGPGQDFSLEKLYVAFKPASE